MYCSHCGHLLEGDAPFCPVCGAAAPQSGADAAPPAQTAWYVPPEETAAPAPVPAEDARFPHMKRAFNLGALSTLIVFGVQTQILALVAGVAAGIFLAPGFSNGGVDELLQRFSGLLDDPDTVLPIAIGYAVTYVVSMLLGILISGTVRKRLKARAIPRRRLSAGRFLRVALITFGVWGAGVLLGNWAQLIVPADQSSALDDSVPMLLVTILGAPVFEELIFRKFLIDRLLPFGERTTVIFTALIFGMAHQNAMQFFLAFFVGLVFAVVYIRSGNILYTMLLHFMINTFASLDTIGCALFGDGFDTIWLIAAGVLVLAGLAAAFLSRRDRFFATEPNYIPGANRAAFRCWGMTLCKIIVAVAILANALLLIFAAGDFPLALLHLGPAACAIAAMFAVAGLASRRVAAAPPQTPDVLQNVTEP